jgi:acyl-CoA synthetase (AMP-forming)/AMP-acid ligase II
VTGGAPVSSEDRTGFRAVSPRADVHVLYGSTEAEPIAHLRPEDAASSPPEARDGVDVGFLVPGLRARVIRPVPGPVALGERGWKAWETAPGEPGELVIAGAHVCGRYFRDPDAVRRAKITDGDGTGGHRTGDVCRVTDRRVRILGRVHNAIRRDGRVLLPVGPEAAMRGLPWVGSAAYVGLPDARLGERACAAFTVRAGHSRPDAADTVRAALEACGVPVDEVRQMDEIPLDARHHSKPEYAELRRLLLGSAS